jgi:hypothetical protein
MTKKTTRTRAEAKRLMWEYYRVNKTYLPKWISTFREEILSQLITGADVSEVFSDLCEKTNRAIA